MQPPQSIEEIKAGLETTEKGFEIMLCLVGGQGAGKSTFFRLLAVRDEWFSDDLRKLDDDNVYRKLQGLNRISDRLISSSDRLII